MEALLSFSSRGAAAPKTPRSSGRAGGRTGGNLIFSFWNWLILFGGYTGFGMWPLDSGTKFDIGCNTNYVWVPLSLGAEIWPFQFGHPSGVPDIG